MFAEFKFCSNDCIISSLIKHVFSKPCPGEDKNDIFSFYIFRVTISLCCLFKGQTCNIGCQIATVIF